MTKMEAITLLAGNIFVDDRGTLSCVNDFSFKDIKRFYQIENFDTDTTRAFHGHMKEAKYVYVLSGSIILCSVFLDDWKNPSKDAPVARVVLSARKPQIAFIPAQHANGFRSLEPGTKVLFFSTTSLEESKGDDYRFPHDYWGNKIWEIEYR